MVGVLSAVWSTLGTWTFRYLRRPMVVGNGLIARAFGAYKDRSEVCIFASGVSDSTTTDRSAFEREQDLLESTLGIHKGLFVYFSTTSIEDASVAHRAYVHHKSAMEELVSKRAASYLIIRLSFVVGCGGNPATIVNHLMHCLKMNEPFDLWTGAERNFLDVADVELTVSAMITSGVRNRTVTVANPQSMTVLEVIEKMEAFLEVKGNYRALDKGAPLNINEQMVESHHPDPQRLVDEDYFTHLLERYYGSSR